MTLTFTAFNTEYGYDEITISSCTSLSCSTNVTLLDHYSGFIIPDPVTSKTGILLIQWHTDDSVVLPGWSATWSITPISSANANLFFLHYFASAPADSELVVVLYLVPALIEWIRKRIVLVLLQA